MAEETVTPETVTYMVEDHVAIITLNRPEQRNALNWDAYARLEQYLRKAVTDPEARCVIVTGADPAFCSGDDVREIMAGPKAVSADTTPVVRHRPTPAAMAALECDKPLIAAVNGAAVGWGMELALYADIRIASEKAKFAELFIKRGLVCDVGGFYRLPSIVGPAKAAELLFTGDVIDAATAERWGLVSRVVPAETVLDEAIAMAEKIAQQPPHALRLGKSLLKHGQSTSYDTLMEMSAAAQAISHLTEDHMEGVTALLEKRPAVFKGQ